MKYFSFLQCFFLCVAEIAGITSDYDISVFIDRMLSGNLQTKNNFLDYNPAKLDILNEDDDRDVDLADIMALSKSKINKNIDAYTNFEKIVIVDVHNIYRSNLTYPIPKGSNMMYVEWNETLSSAAEGWLKECQFKRDKGENMTLVQGQNLYQGPSRHPKRPLWLWYEEYKNYFFNNFTCKEPKSQYQCEHMLQILWHNSAQIGCARKSSCFPQESKNMLVSCHYFQPGSINFTGFQVFKYGWQCTSCDQPDGNLCYHGLCIKKKTCKAYGFDCECKLNCKNCVKPNPKTCRCEPCMLGWDSPDCSLPCNDAIDIARKKGGFCRWKSKTMGKKFCQNYYVKAACRMECGLCKPLNLSQHENLCCKGRMCPLYHVLDENCDCKVDCPSNLCLYPPPTTPQPPISVPTVSANETESKTPKGKQIEVSNSASKSPFSVLKFTFYLLLLLIL